MLSLGVSLRGYGNVVRFHHRSKRSFATIVETPIVIVGGGPTGLMLSNLLSSYGTPSVVLEARSPEQIFHHPQAHFLNTRTMEILRHSLPNVYQEVCNQMPPVDRWKYFQWGRSMMSPGIARVVHPVDQPLEADTDSNGLLLPLGAERKQGTPVSACSVGHLAQHHFSRILWEAAHTSLHSESQLVNNVRVNRVVDDTSNEDFPLRVETDNSEYHTKIVIAADGSQSPLRKAWNIGMKGQENMQNLVNVHVKLAPVLSEKLKSNGTSAMLHFIYNEEVVSVVVCHTEGELVLQIPYFPPYQTMERDFSPKKVRRMVEAALGVTGTTEEELQIDSVRSWEMSSLIAQSYTFGSRCALAGDAAHVFPPAGGFGMNTGLQDAHNLAWRLSLLMKNKHKDSNVRQVLQRYAGERRHIAQQNAALSVRNYNRTLQLAKACYLNDQHPSALIAVLSAPPLNFLPLESRQDMFQQLVRTAMWPLSFLEEETNLHGKHMRRNVRDILSRGEGLPLLFPKYELGFSYVKGTATVEGNWVDDTAGYSPEVRVGNLIPHVVMKVISPEIHSAREKYPHLRPLNVDSVPETLHVTLTDIASQVRKRLSCDDSSPCFVAIFLDCQAVNLNEASSMAKVHAVQVQGNTLSPSFQSPDAMILHDEGSTLSSMVQCSPAVLLVRPDGAVTSILDVTGESADTISTLIRQGIQQALGF